MNLKYMRILEVEIKLQHVEIQSLRHQLDQTIEDCAKKLNAQGKQLAECQAQTPLAEGPWEEQAYNAGKKDGRREALLEAASECCASDILPSGKVSLKYDDVIQAADGIRSMAKELE